MKKSCVEVEESKLVQIRMSSIGDCVLKVVAVHLHTKIVLSGGCGSQMLS